MADIEKSTQYAIILLGNLQEVFNKESEFHIDKKELIEEDNLTHFMHALINIVPTIFFNKVTGEDKQYIEVNHLANLLCFKYTINTEDEESEK